MLNKTVTVELRSIVTVFCFAIMKKYSYEMQQQKGNKS